ncbi:cyclase family protein [Paenibacillus sp. FSL W8-0194]|uniref:cyclase family protein n=1 Tax=Paenibacillus sp. FSL W8-0194 TaxID=2921711 RepID=UPI0030DAFDE4
MKYIELSRLIQDGLPGYPGDTVTELKPHKTLQRDHYNNHQLNINMHAGTHIDGPMHLTDRRVYLSEYSPDKFIGEGCLLNVRGEREIGYQPAYEERIKEHGIVLLHTGHGKRYGHSDYFTDYPVLTLGLAELFVRKNVKLVGLDTPSPDKFPFEVHKYLFEHDILLIENLTNLDGMEGAGSFEVIAMPLYIQADSSIARVVARVK